MLSFGPCHKRDDDRLGVHRRVTKTIKQQRNLQYEEKLKELRLFSLEKRKLRGVCVIIHHYLQGG